jgi:hypothetical protein
MTGDRQIPLERVRDLLESHPGVFGPEFETVDIPDGLANARGTHADGETRFVTRVVEEEDGEVELADVHRVTAGPATDGDLYVVAKHWSDSRFPADEIEFPDR